MAVSAATTPSSPGLNSGTSPKSTGARFSALITNPYGRRYPCMIKAGRFGLVALLAGLIAACGPPPTVTGGASPSGVPTPSAAAASPTVSPAPAGRLLALVTLKGSDQLVVRDITDITHPTTVAKLPFLTAPQFINASEISYIDYEHGTIVRMPLSGSPKTVVAQSGQLAGYVAWSPDGTTVIYTTYNAAAPSCSCTRCGPAKTVSWPRCPRCRALVARASPAAQLMFGIRACSTRAMAASSH